MEVLKTEYQQLEKVLIHVNSMGFDVSAKREADAIGEAVNLSTDEAYLTLDYLTRHGYLLMNMSKPNPGFSPHKFYWTTYEGRLLLSLGGFEQMYKDQRKGRRYQRTKTAVMAANAFAIIIIAVLAIIYG